MQISLSPLRIVLSVLSIFLFTFFFQITAETFPDYTRALYAIVGGIVFSLTLIVLEKCLEKLNFKNFAIFALGTSTGLLLAGSLIYLFNSIAVLANVDDNSFFILCKLSTYLFCIYFGNILISNASEKHSFSFPFIEKNTIPLSKTKQILLDPSVLSDHRLIDLANSGLLDQQLIFPLSFIKEMEMQGDSSDEQVRNKAKKNLEVFKKLEILPELKLRIIECETVESSESQQFMVHLARSLNAYLLTGDIGKIQLSELDDVRVININFLSQALKPLTATGETIAIKVQRYGKEPRQGVGYLDDGTMVVINGGAQFIGETIKAIVLSVKHTPSGRMIFCNAAESELLMSSMSPDLETSAKSFFAI